MVAQRSEELLVSSFFLFTLSRVVVRNLLKLCRWHTFVPLGNLSQCLSCLAVGFVWHDAFLGLDRRVFDLQSCLLPGFQRLRRVSVEGLASVKHGYYLLQKTLKERMAQSKITSKSCSCGACDTPGTCLSCVFAHVHPCNCITDFGYKWFPIRIFIRGIAGDASKMKMK